MRGRVSGRPTKWLYAKVLEQFPVGRRGVKFEVWEKWRKVDKKLGTLTVGVGGLRWLPSHGKKVRQQSWNRVRDWFEGGST